MRVNYEMNCNFDDKENYLFRYEGYFETFLIRF